ncbi:DeoR/GlpR family DNA-binding transcription regulator [Salibacterium aidingense]|uniref:DeoR/GlpR family DNA-binding transcription regulator n=1 Tax=Salibacterium aidingense TaxID=384933 RepID=UPI0004291A0F|nr:DeoR/GlpR family DNA-binding transcription regulator [Salibacterium aidingense]
MKASKRRAAILQLMQSRTNVTVDHLIHQFGVSEETIRRDLRQLDDSGYVKRVYGGAVKIEKTTRYLSYQERLNSNYNEKMAIGQECLQLLEEGDSVFIDGKTTCLVFARNIPSSLNLTIVTNSIILAHELISRKSHATIHILGGELDENGMMNGPKVDQELRKYRFDKAIFSCIGVNAKGCYFGKMEAQQNAHTLKEISSNLLLLADSAKINRHAFLFGLPLEDFTYLITDEGAPVGFSEKVKKTSCRLIKSSIQ